MINLVQNLAMVALANFQKEFLKSCSTRQSMLCYWHCVSLPSLLGTYIVLLRTHTGKFLDCKSKSKEKALARKNVWIDSQRGCTKSPLQPVCCKKQQKKFLTSYWFLEMGTSEDSEWYKIDPGWSEESLGLIYNQFGIIQVLQRSPILQINNWSGTFFAASYSKPALLVALLVYTSNSIFMTNSLIV